MGRNRLFFIVVPSLLLLLYFSSRQFQFAPILAKDAPSLQTSATAMKYDYIQVDPNVHKALTRELQNLGIKARQIAASFGPKKKCSRKKLHIVGPGEGSTTNQIFTLAHALGVAADLQDTQSYTLVLPQYMLETLKSFDISLLKEIYCLEIARERTQADHETLQLALKRREKEERRRGAGSTESVGIGSILRSIFTKSSSNLLDGDSSYSQGATTAGPFFPGDVLITSRDAYLWGGEVYYEMGGDEMGKMQKRMKEEILGINKAKKLPGQSKVDYAIGAEGDDVNAACTCDRGADYLYEVAPKYKLQRISQAERSHMVDRTKFAGHVACVVASLWSKVTPEVLFLASAVLGTAFGGDMKYHSAHRRGFEGSCTTEYINHPLKGIISSPLKGEDHPMCSFSPDYVRTLLHSPAPLFLTSDQQSSDKDQKWVKDHQARVGWAVHDEIFGASSHDSATKRAALTYGYDTQTASDILLAAVGQGEFIGQPRSTFSWQIEVLRACIGRGSLPIGGLNETDVYFRSTLGDPSEGKLPGGWWTRLHVQDALSQTK
jgi:hypothetical protein